MDPCIAVQRGRPTSTRRRVPVPVSSLSRGAKLGEERVISWTRGHAVGSQIQPAETGKGPPPPVKTGVRATKPSPAIGPSAGAGARARSSERQEKDGAAFRARLEEKGRRRGLFSSLSTCARATPLRACAERRDANRFRLENQRPSARSHSLSALFLLPRFPFFICLRAAAAARHHAARGKTLSHQSASHHPPISFRTTPRGNERTSLREGVVVVSHSRANVQRSLVRRKPRRTPGRKGRVGDARGRKQCVVTKTTLSQAWSGNCIRGPQCAFEMSMFMCPAVHKLTRN